MLGDQAFVLRYFEPGGDDRLLVVNFGRDLHLPVCPEPLLASPPGTKWAIVLSTESPEYGGGGRAPADTLDEGWRICGEAAVVLAPVLDDAPGVPATEGGRLGTGTKRIVY